MEQLIENFEAANPDITVTMTHFPYADYRTKVAAAIPAGEGPDVVQLFYGWLNDYKAADDAATKKDEAAETKFGADYVKCKELEVDSFDVEFALKAEAAKYEAGKKTTIEQYWNDVLAKTMGGNVN